MSENSPISPKWLSAHITRGPEGARAVSSPFDLWAGLRLPNGPDPTLPTSAFIFCTTGVQEQGYGCITVGASRSHLV